MNLPQDFSVMSERLATVEMELESLRQAVYGTNEGLAERPDPDWDDEPDFLGEVSNKPMDYTAKGTAYVHKHGDPVPNNCVVGISEDWTEGRKATQLIKKLVKNYNQGTVSIHLIVGIVKEWEQV